MGEDKRVIIDAAAADANEANDANDYEPESAFVADLRALARAAPGVSDFEIVWEGLRIAVSYTSGSNHNVQLEVAYDVATAHNNSSGASSNRPVEGTGGYRDAAVAAAAPLLTAIRPMKVSLTPERRVHVEGKASGLDTEHQTGDAKFDEAVYVDAPTADPLGHLFASERVRRAVLDLFDLDFTTIVIDDDKGRVTASMTSFPDLRPKGGAQTALSAFAELAQGLPPITAAAGRAHPVDTLERPTKTLAGWALVTFALATPAYLFLSGRRCSGNDDGTITELFGCAWPGLIGMSVGLVAAFIMVTTMKPRVHAKYRGTSSSSRRINTYLALLGALAFTVVGTFCGIAIAHAF